MDHSVPWAIFSKELFWLLFSILLTCLIPRTKTIIILHKNLRSCKAISLQQHYCIIILVTKAENSLTKVRAFIASSLGRICKYEKQTQRDKGKNLLFQELLQLSLLTNRTHKKISFGRLQRPCPHPE